MSWVIATDEGKPALRLASDAAGLHLLPTPEESEARAREAAERRAALGKAEGKSEGRAEGKAEGRAEGKAEGRAEGKAEGRGESLLNVLRLRDLPFDAATEARIRETRDSELLDRWLARALLAASVDEVLAD